MRLARWRPARGRTGQAAAGAVLLGATACLGAAASEADAAPQNACAGIPSGVEEIVIKRFAGRIGIEGRPAREIVATCTGVGEVLPTGSSVVLVGAGAPSLAQRLAGRVGLGAIGLGVGSGQISAQLPFGTRLVIEDAAGRIEIRDLQGPVSLTGPRVDAAVLNVASLSVATAGDATLTVNYVAGALDLLVEGEADVVAGSVGLARVSARRGEVELTEVRGGLEVALDGDAEVEVARLAGATRLALEGNAHVAIADGRADPFEVTLNGPGRVRFGGTAVDPRVSPEGALERVSIGAVEKRAGSAADHAGPTAAP